MATSPKARFDRVVAFVGVIFLFVVFCSVLLLVLAGIADTRGAETPLPAVVLWGAFGLAAVVVLAVIGGLMALVSSTHFHHPGYCECGYDLRVQVDRKIPTCPECGRTIESS